MGRHFWQRATPQSSSQHHHYKGNNTASSHHSGAPSSAMMSHHHPSSTAASAAAAQVHWTPEAVASLPPPGMGGPTQIVFAPQSSRYVAYVSVQPHTTTTTASTASHRQAQQQQQASTSSATGPLFRPLATAADAAASQSSSSSRQNGNRTTTTTTSSTDRILLCLDLESPDKRPEPLLRWNPNRATTTSHSSPNNKNTASSSPTWIASSTPVASTTTTTAARSTSSSKRRLVDSSSAATSASNSPRSSSSTTQDWTAEAFLKKSPYQQQQILAAMEERMRKDRKIHALAASFTQFSWAWCTPRQQPRQRRRRRSSGMNSSHHSVASGASNGHGGDFNDSQDQDDITTALPSSSPQEFLRILAPARGDLYVQDGLHFSGIPVKGLPYQQQQRSQFNAANSVKSQIGSKTITSGTTGLVCIHDKTRSDSLSAMDAQLSPDGSMVAFTANGEIFVQSASTRATVHAPAAASSVSRSTSSVGRLPAPYSQHEAIQLTAGASITDQDCIRYGVADFVAQEEMDRYKGFWWHPDSNGILFTVTDESDVPIYRIMHQDVQGGGGPMYSGQSGAQNTGAAAQGSAAVSPNSPSSQDLGNSGHGSNHGASSSSSSSHRQDNNTTRTGGGGAGGTLYEDHRYPFAGQNNPSVKLGFVKIDRDSVLHPWQQEDDVPTAQRESRQEGQDGHQGEDDGDEFMQTVVSPQERAFDNWQACQWFDAPREASEYLARVYWLPDGSAVAQWQNRTQTVSVLYRLDFVTGKGRTLLLERRTEAWINLHRMFRTLDRPIHPDELQIGAPPGQSAPPAPQHSSIHADHPGNKVPPMPNPLPESACSFLFASERSGFSHLYLYTFCPGINGDQAVLLKSVTSGDWMVESIVGLQQDHDVVYVTGTYDSVLERHLYAVPILGHQRWQQEWNLQQQQLQQAAQSGSSSVGVAGDELSAPTPSAGSVYVSQASAFHHQQQMHSSQGHSKGGNNPNGVRRGLSKVMHALSGGKAGRGDKSQETAGEALQRPVRLTMESGMHSVVMDEFCKYFIDTGSDLNRPTSVKIYKLPETGPWTAPTVATGGGKTLMRVSLFMTLYDAAKDDKAMAALTTTSNNGRDPAERLVNSLPAPELISFPTSDGSETLHAALYRPDTRIHGPGPYPLICAVYGGPHVQRVNRSWSQCADMRAQRLRSLGFCVVKCDNRGSSRRGLAFESAIARRLGRLEVLDQVATVRNLILRGIADPSRVGVYGWSYGGYLSAMCLCRAPDIFHVAVAGAPVTSWDGYDTHYTERYMGLPGDNPAGYRESAVFDHVPNMRGKLMIVHGLIDENVHFRHTTRLINKLIAAGKDYDLLIFPEERHSPRRLRDRIYMERRISEYFVRHLGVNTQPTALDLLTSMAAVGAATPQGLRTMAGHL